MDPVNMKRQAQRAKRNMKANTQRVQGPDKQPRGRPRTSKTARATKRQHVVDQGKLATLAARAMANGTPGADAVLAAALDTPGGRKQFPNLAHKQEQNAQHAVIVRAVASTLNGLSSRPPPGSSPKQKKSVKCNNAANMPLLATIMKHTDTQLKSAELASVLGVSPVQVRQVNKDKK